MQLGARGSWLVLGVLVAGSAAFAACGGGGGSSGNGESPSDGGVDGALGDVAPDASAADGDDAGLVSHGNVVALTINPTIATIPVTNGTSTPTVFQAIAEYQDGTSAPIGASWTLDRPDLGTIDGGGSFQASGLLGGQAIVTASAGGQQATAKANVVLRVEQDGAGIGLSTADKAKFDTPDATPSGTLLYPYDKTVFPRGLLPPEIMWGGGSAGDVYRVHVKEQYVETAFYTLADPPSRFTMPVDVWNALTESNAGEPAVVDVTRMSAGVAHAPMTESWTIANGSLRGSIYYWAINTGQLMKIAPSTSTPTVVFDSGPADVIGTPPAAGYGGTPSPPWAAVGSNKRCVACHTVSKDGSTIAAVFEKNGSTASPWGTIDLKATTPSVVQMTPYASSTIYLGITPNGAYTVANDVNMTMHLADAKTGSTLASALDGFADKTCDPSFSPNGAMLAFSSNVVGGYPVEFWQADLDVMDFSAGDPKATPPVAPSLANRRQIVPGGGAAIAFPSFSPDSKWIFYQKGDYTRAKYATSSVGHNDLYVADVAKAVGEIPLATASGAGLEARNQHISYQPTVNPVSVGGYTWIVFFSPRDYGNELLSTSNPTYENRKQLWVAAIDNNPTAGKDPSHPAFWLPGQDLTTANMSGYWALEPCRADGTSCDQGFECCSGYCHADASGKLSCSSATTSCSAIGDKCTTDADCCDTTNTQCVGGFCAVSRPQ